MSELPPEARALLEAARTADDPSPSERRRADASARVRLAAHGVVLPPLAQSAAGSEALRGPSPAGGGTTGVKLGLGVLVLCAGGVFGLRNHFVEREAVPVAAPSVAEKTTATTHAASAAAVTAPEAPDARRARAAEPASTPSTPSASQRRPRSGMAEVREDVAAELELVAEADAQLRSADYEGALSTLMAHTRRFPRGALREERQALRVLALCGKQPDERARRERERFLRASPDSVLTARVRAACEEPVEPAP